MEESYSGATAKDIYYGLCMWSCLKQQSERRTRRTVYAYYFFIVL